jgi:hypothetical protein
VTEPRAKRPWPEAREVEYRTLNVRLERSKDHELGVPAITWG